MDLSEIERLFSQGRYLEVRLHTEGFVDLQNHLREKQLYALSLAKSGAAGAAEKFFKDVYEQNRNDAESAGIMGGILKELFRYTRDQHYAVEARKIYFDNFSITRNCYTGINAAAMHAITGRLSTAKEIAKELLSILPTAPTEFWDIVTLAEAKLMLKQTHEAVELYNEGRKLAAKDWGKVNIVYNQLWLLNHYFPIPGMIIKAYSPPKIAVFMGHMVDKEGARARFPKSIESQIKNEINERIKMLDIQIGYCSLACGGDILFAEALGDTHGDVNIHLPFAKEDFIQTSVQFAGQDWVERFDRLEKKWPVHYLSKEKFHGNDDAFVLLGRSLMGAAILRAQMTHSESYLLTVLSKADDDRKEGGTRDMLKLWPNMERYINIDPSLFVTHHQHQSLTSTTESHSSSSWRTAYLCCAEFPQFTLADSELNKLLDKHRSEFQDELIYDEAKNGRMIIALSSSYGVMRLAQMMIADYETKTSKHDQRVIFHAGIFKFEIEKGEREIVGLDLEKVNNALRYALSATLLCSHSFATSLVLDPGNFIFHHAGIFEHGTEIFSIEVGRD